MDHAGGAGTSTYDVRHQLIRLKQGNLRPGDLQIPRKVLYLGEGLRRGRHRGRRIRLAGGHGCGSCLL